MSHLQSSPIYSTFGGDEDMCELVEMFVEEMPERIERIIDLLQAAEWDELGRMAHQLKGAVGSYGFDPMTPVAAQLEQVTRAEEPEDTIRRAADALADMLARARSGCPSETEPTR